MKTYRKSEEVCFQFNDVRVDRANLRVHRAGEPRKITPRAFEVLIYLIEHRGAIAEKQELFEQVWKDTFVTDNALTRIVKEIRQVIGDDADAPRYIETIPKHGYRFIAEVQDLVESTNQRDEKLAADSQITQRTQVPRTASSGLGLTKARLLTASVLALTAIAGLIIWRTQKDSEIQAPAVLKNVQLTTWPGLDVFPALAPDGNSVAYSSDHNGSFEIYVKSLTPGAREIQITSDGQQNFEAAWSPDGKLIAYYSRNHGGIWLVPASGGAAKQLTEFGSHPAWSPDGSFLAFQSYGLNDLSATSVGALPPSSLWVVPASGGDPRPLTQVGTPPGGHGQPTWSPDGKRIVFVAYDGHLSTLWTVSVTEKELRRITDRRAWFYDPIYSPDGEYVYYGGVSDPGNFLLYKLRVSHSSGKAIGEPVEFANAGLMRIKNLTISSDGKRIAYSAPMMKGSRSEERRVGKECRYRWFFVLPPRVVWRIIYKEKKLKKKKKPRSFSSDGKRIAYSAPMMKGS